MVVGASVVVVVVVDVVVVGRVVVAGATVVDGPPSAAPAGVSGAGPSSNDAESIVAGRASASAVSDEIDNVATKDTKHAYSTSVVPRWRLRPSLTSVVLRTRAVRR